MLNITKIDITVVVEEKIYTICIDQNQNLDLLEDGNSLKSKRLAKGIAKELIKELGFEDELNNLPNHTNRNSPHTSKVLKLLQDIIKGNKKWN